MTPPIKINKDNLSQFSSDVESLWSSKPIHILDRPPSPIDFLREYVNLSVPVIIKNAFPIVTLDELVESADSNDDDDDMWLNVDVSPDGHADTIRIVDGKNIFVEPEVRKMSFCEFRDQLRYQSNNNESNQDDKNILENDDNGLLKLSSENYVSDRDVSVTNNNNGCHEVLYYSRQNDCLRQELQRLTTYFPSHIDFASQAFNAKPDAINLWIGDENAVSSMHKDHYENIFCVASGIKSFTICPPADALFFREKKIPSGQFRHDVQGWTVDLHKDDHEQPKMVRWIESDIERLVDNSSIDDRLDYIEKFPFLQYVHPMKVTLEAGDMFYLPSLWFHRVTQLCETVAVNYWYDMRFDSPNWCYFNFLQHLNCDTDNDSNK